MEGEWVYIDAGAVRFGIWNARLRCSDRVDRGELGLWSALEDQGFQLVPRKRELLNDRGERVLNPYQMGVGNQFFGDIAARMWGVEVRRPAISQVRLPMDALEYDGLQRWTPASLRGGEIGVYVPALEAVLRRHGWQIVA